MIISKLKIVLTAFLLMIFPLLWAQDRGALITKELTELFEKNQIAGMVVSMVDKDSVLYQNGFGYADIKTETKYTSEHIQNIGSTSKTFIGVCLMTLVEQGKLTLNDPVNKYLPFEVINSYFPDRPITIRQLATHTSSINDRPKNYDFKVYYIDSADTTSGFSKKGLSLEYKIFLNKIKNNNKLSLDHYLKAVLSEQGIWYNKKNFSKIIPGTQYAYSNIGATLAAYIIEVISGMSFSEFSKLMIFEPLKMNETGWFYEDIDHDRFVTRYLGKKKAIIPKYDISSYPDGGLKTTVKDLSVFLQEMLKGYFGEGTLLSKASYGELFKNQIPFKADDRSGIFWDIFGSEGVGDIGHIGSDPGIFTLMYFSPKTKIGKILIANSSDLEDQLILIWEKFINMESLFMMKTETD